MVNTPHSFKRPLSDAALSAVIIGAVTLISALPALSVLARGLR